MRDIQKKHWCVACFFGKQNYTTEKPYLDIIWRHISFNIVCIYIHKPKPIPTLYLASIRPSGLGPSTVPRVPKGMATTSPIIRFMAAICRSCGFHWWFLFGMNMVCRYIHILSCIYCIYIYYLHYIIYCICIYIYMIEYVYIYIYLFVGWTWYW